MSAQIHEYECDIPDCNRNGRVITPDGVLCVECANEYSAERGNRNQ